MRAILVIVVIVLLLAAAGWITFSGGSDRPSVTVETDKIKQDIEVGKEALTGAIKNETEPAPAEPVPPMADEPAPVVAPGASPN